MSKLSLTVTRRDLVRWPSALPSISPRLIVAIEAPPGISNIGICGAVSATRMSISLSFSSLLRSFFRKLSRVVGRRAGADERIEHALFGGFLGLGAHVLALRLLDERHADLDEIADDAVDVAADVADLGELRRFDLEERRACEFRKTARDLGFADAGRADHQNVLRQHFVAKLAGQLLAPPAIAQRDGDGALGVVLADDVAVEFGDDFAR